MNELLQEFVDSRGVGVRVDRTESVIRGVKLLGLASRNGRKYLPAALAAAAQMYEGAKVNVNHPKGHPLSARDYQDRLGAIRSVVMRTGEGLFGDLHFNPKHALAEQLLWDAQHAPENLGLSHNVEARTARQGVETVVEAILRVQSVDLVADPATTRGLYESLSDSSAGGQRHASGIAATDNGASALASVTLSNLRAARPDLVHALQEELSHEAVAMRAELDELRSLQAARQRRAAIRQLLCEFRLPDPDATDEVGRAIVSEMFLQSLSAAPDVPAMRRLVEERSALLARAASWTGAAAEQGSGRPVSREQRYCQPPAAPEMDAAGFALSIR